MQRISHVIQERQEAAAVLFLRRVPSISWMDRMTNEAVLGKADTGRKLMTMIAETHKRFLSNVNKKEAIENSTVTGS